VAVNVNDESCNSRVPLGVVYGEVGFSVVGTQTKLASTVEALASIGMLVATNKARHPNRFIKRAISNTLKF